jgi:hypothetical protein
MSQITIQCRLIAIESTRQKLWQLMAERNTPLINELLQLIALHPDFLIWQQKGRLPSTIVNELCKPLKTDARFIRQPTRFYISATHHVEYILKSWLILQRRRQRKLEGKLRWLEILKSDEELQKLCNCDLEVIRKQASVMLAQAQQQISASNNDSQSLANSLFTQYQDTKKVLPQAAIAYLLKNGCKVNQKEENPQQFAKRQRKVQISIRRLIEQIESSVPKGRDLTGQTCLETLQIAVTTAPQTEAEARSWQDELLKQPSSLPFPIAIKSNEVMVWDKDLQGRLGVRFTGLIEHRFGIYCDRRQLHWFERFLEDQVIKHNGKDTHSSGLFTLRSAHIAWQLGEGKGKPWNINHLNLYCTVDTRLWTSEGTEQVRQEKAIEVARTLTNMKEKESLSKTQEGYIKRLQSTLERINNPFPRPSKSPHVTQPHILIGVCIGLEHPATVAVVDVNTGRALTYRSIRQLLGDHYALLNRQRYQKRQNASNRHKAQKQFTNNQFSESELAQYIDRLIAKAVITVAQEFRASSIVLPKLDDMREAIQAEIQARAELKIPNSVEAQKKYAKQYCIHIHNWSYDRLIQCIQSQAVKYNIAIEEAKQPIRGSPQDKAKSLVFAAYQARG